jgi:branched-chain amino acid transport system substrate-binding protein
MQGDFAAKYLYNVLGVRKIAVMHDGGAYGQGLSEMTADFFKELGGEVLGVEPITPGETDYSAPLAKVASLNPELIYYGGYDADAAVLVTQMAGAGMQNVKFFGDDGTYGVNYLNLAGAAAEGTFSTYVPLPESDAFTKFRADYLADFGQEQGELSPFSPHGYDAAMLILTALDKVAVKSGDKLIIPRQALAQAVRATANYTGLTGTLTCSATGECAAANIQFMKVENGKWVKGPGQ